MYIYIYIYIYIFITNERSEPTQQRFDRHLVAIYGMTLGTVVHDTREVVGFI